MKTIKNIMILDDTNLLMLFDNGEIKKCDIKKFFDINPLFKPLNDKTIFFKAKVVDNGYGVRWNESIDISSNELFNSSIEMIEKR